MAGPGKRVPAPDLGNVAALLGDVYARLGEQIVAGVVEAGFPQRSAHSAVFANIDAEGTRVSELAARAGMTAQSMGELVESLISLGYVVKVPDPADGRARIVRLTAKGEASVAAALAVIGRIDDAVADLLGPERARRLVRDLRRLADHDWSDVVRTRAAAVTRGSGSPPI